MKRLLLLALLPLLVSACGKGATPPETETPEEEPLPEVPLGEPISVSEDALGEWVWIDEPGMRCSRDERGGFAINFTDRSRDVVLFLQGGGICYNAFTCLFGGAPTSVGSDPINTALVRSIREHTGIFDREAPTNPFRDANFVVVPHCTGDHHTGNKVSIHGDTEFHHVGYTNMTRVLERVVPTFRDADRVVLTGFSAGGVGIASNYHQLATAFASVGQPAPTLIIDAGPFMRPPYLTQRAHEDLTASWGLEETVGTFCPSCLTDGFYDLYRVNLALHPGLRSALICSDADSVVRTLYSVLNGSAFSAAQMREGLADLVDWSDSVQPSAAEGQHRSFIYASDRHGALSAAPLSATPGLVDFLNAQLGTGPWENVQP